jgi:hypothetical protein
LGQELYRGNLPAPAIGATWNGALSAPTIANIDSDADLELVIGTVASGVVAYKLPNSANARILWGTGRGGYHRTGASEAIAVDPVQQQVATPTLSPDSGTYSGSVTVTTSDATSGATIYYTTDGSTPTTISPVYTGPLTFTQTTMLQAMAAASGMTNSAVASATYTTSGSGSSSAVTWTDTTNVTVAGSSIQKTGGAGAKSREGSNGRPRNIGVGPETFLHSDGGFLAGEEGILVGARTVD